MFITGITNCTRANHPEAFTKITFFDFPMFKLLSYAIKSLKVGMVLDYFPY